MKGLSPEEYERLHVTIGAHTKKRMYSPLECAELLDRGRRVGGYSMQELATLVGIRDTGTISNFLRLLDVVPSHCHLVDWGRTGSTVAFTSAALLAKLSKEDQETCFVASLVNRLRKTEVEQIVQIRQRSGRDVSECVEEVVAMRPIVTTVNVVIGAITSASVTERLAQLLQSEKDHLIQRAIEVEFPNMQTCSSRLGNDTFTISASDDDTNYLKSRAKTLEDTITEQVGSLL